MACIKKGVDDLGFPVRTRTQMLERLDELSGGTYSAGLNPDPENPLFFSRSNDIMFQCLTGVIPMRPSRKTASAVGEDHCYAITLTTCVVNGTPRKGYSAFLAVLQRIKELPGVLSIKGNFELTQQNALHVHALVRSSKYLNAAKVRSANGNEHVKVDKMRNPKQLASTEKYIYKDLDNPKCLSIIHIENNTVPTTKIDL